MAPGKVFLSGEYSVLTPGQPALVLAVDRQLSVFSSESDRYRIEVPRWDIDLRGDSSGLNNGSVDDPRALFLDKLLSRTIENIGAPSPVHLVAEPTKTDLLARDLGLGTSAAWAVIMARALLPNEPKDSRTTLDLALKSHSEVQGGRGSGADVATSWAGTSIRYERSKTGSPKISPIKKPTEFLARVLYTGNAQRTGPAVAHYENLVRTRPALVQKFLARSTAVVNKMESTLAHPPRFVAAVEQANVVLSFLAQQMHQETPIPTWLKNGLKLVRAAVKPCGALGGDCLLAATVASRYLPEVDRLAASAGLEVLPLSAIFRT
jgi:phosphomevalonate kinase